MQENNGESFNILEMGTTFPQNDTHLRLHKNKLQKIPEENMFIMLGWGIPIKERTQGLQEGWGSCWRFSKPAQGWLPQPGTLSPARPSLSPLLSAWRAHSPASKDKRRARRLRPLIPPLPPVQTKVGEGECPDAWARDSKWLGLRACTGSQGRTSSQGQVGLWKKFRNGDRATLTLDPQCACASVALGGTLLPPAWHVPPALPLSGFHPDQLTQGILDFRSRPSQNFAFRERPGVGQNAPIASDNQNRWIARPPAPVSRFRFQGATSCPQSWNTAPHPHPSPFYIDEILSIIIMIEYSFRGGGSVNMGLLMKRMEFF